jgi:DNA mismatch repair ATPase MutS
MNKEELLEKYSGSVLSERKLEQTEDKIILYLSLFRLLTFAGGAVLIALAFHRSILAGFVSAILILVLFLFLLKLFSKHSREKEFHTNLAKINQDEKNALSGDLSAFNNGNSYVNIKHDFSYDVDLFGDSSLFQYINRTVTGYGRDILAGWLSDPYPLSDKLNLRQEAVKELASKNSWRQAFMANGMSVPIEKKEISGILDWLNEKAVIGSSLLKQVLLYLLPGLAILSLILVLAGVVSYSIFVVIFLVNLIYVASGLKKTNSIHKALSKKYDFLSSMTGLLKTFENESFTSPMMNEIKMNISGRDVSASVAVNKLERLIHSFDSRNNIMVAFVLNGIFLWDYQSTHRLEKWKAQYNKLFPGWLEMIGCVDALISLGNYTFNNSGFVFPEISEDGSYISARDLGHQLIDERKRVCNDFTLGEKGTVCIISGANMAGKSTFLRTVAINYILAMSGAPVCASEMHFLPAKIFTSMRTVDSLSGNESYFYAELRRLSILKSRIEAGEPVLFILDEILKGTNSEDKSAGSKLFLKKIIESRGTGLIATHDISVGKLEEDYNCVINKCFEIEIDGENISFDYKIRPGITKKMNAVFLMRQMHILD